MCRVKSVVGDAIMVALEDVVPYDILHSRGNESDPIIAEIIQKDGRFKFVYLPSPLHEVKETLWMAGGHVFIHDLRNEKAEFIPA